MRGAFSPRPVLGNAESPWDTPWGKRANQERIQGVSWDPGTGAPRNTIASRSRGVLESLYSVSFHSLALWFSLQSTSSASPVPKSVCPQFEIDLRGCVPTPNAPTGWSSTPGPINQGQRVALQGTTTALLGPSPVHGRRSHSQDWRTEPDQYPKMGLLQT